MDNLNIYNQVRTVPKEALKLIQAGRLRGKSDINPMWRLEKLTELFGPCGIGWKYVITEQWLEEGANNEIAAFVNIELFVKTDNGWSEAIPGTGGSSFVTKEKSGLYTSDECFKMALTDAISVACKALGFGADVYWQAGATKYSKTTGKTTNSKPKAEQLNWSGFWNTCKKSLKLSEEQVREMAGEYFGQEIKNLKDVIKTRDDQVKFYEFLTNKVVSKEDATDE